MKNSRIGHIVQKNGMLYWNFLLIFPKRRRGMLKAKSHPFHSWSLKIDTWAIWSGKPQLWRFIIMSLQFRRISLNLKNMTQHFTKTAFLLLTGPEAWSSSCCCRQGESLTQKRRKQPKGSNRLRLFSRTSWPAKDSEII